MPWSSAGCATNTNVDLKAFGMYRRPCRERCLRLLQSKHWKSTCFKHKFPYRRTWGIGSPHEILSGSRTFSGFRWSKVDEQYLDHHTGGQLFLFDLKVEATNAGSCSNCIFLRVSESSLMNTLQKVNPREGNLMAWGSGTDHGWTWL